MQIVKLAREAMATRFEMVLHGSNANHLRAAGEEALDEIDRLEAQLSLYRPESDIARVNARAAYEPVRVAPLVFNLLKRAQELQRATAGAFDVTIAPMVRCWGFMGGTGHLPNPEDLAQAREKIGMQHVILEEQDFTVRFDREGVMIDLGAIGKGLAIDRASEFVREAGVTSALLHGGTSTVSAIGKPCDAEAWKITIDSPAAATKQVAPSLEETLTMISLIDETLSVSAIWGRSFRSREKTFGHVIDPRTGEPVSHALLAAVALPSATETDALSTALLVLGMSGLETIAQIRPAARTLIVTPHASGYECVKRGL